MTMTTVDRNVLANDLERLGLKAISGSVRRDTISIKRALEAVRRLAGREETRATIREHAKAGTERYADKLRYEEHAAEARGVLERYGAGSK